MNELWKNEVTSSTWQSDDKLRIALCWFQTLSLAILLHLPLPLYRNTTNFHRFSFHTYLRWNFLPLCHIAAAAIFPKLISIQLFVIHRKWKSGENIDNWLAASSHESSQMARSCGLHVCAVDKNDIKLQQCGETVKVWNQHKSC